MSAERQHQAMLIWQNEAGETLSLRFDVVPTTTHEGITEVTEHPAEKGADIADHVRQGLQRFSLEGVVSNSAMASNEDARLAGAIVPTPPSENYDVADVELDLPPKPVKLGNPAGQAIGAARDAFTKGDGNKATLFYATSFVDRVKETVETIDTLQAGQLISILTPRREYVSMQLVRNAETITAKDGTVGRFNLEFKQLRTATAETVDAPVPAEPIGAPPKARGSQSGKDDPKDSEKKNALKRSLAKQAGSYVGSLFGG